MVNLRSLQCGPNSAAWLLAPPSYDEDIQFSPAEWRALLLFRIGAPVGKDDRCHSCAANMPCNGDHSLACTSSGIYRRHNKVRDLVAEECRRAGWEAQLEVAVPLPTSLATTTPTHSPPPDPPDPPPPTFRPRPADVFLPNQGGARPIALDITISHPLR